MPSESTTSSISTTTKITTVPVPPDTGDLVDPEIRKVTVDGHPLLVAWAGDPATRSWGLMEVGDLGDLDGMLFDLGAERSVSFTMLNTLMPLDIYFFDSEGRGVGMLEMVPCERRPCPSYSIAAPARYALEIPAGSSTFGSEPDLGFP